MAATVTIQKNFSVGGMTFNESESIAAEAIASRDKTNVPVGYAGTLTTRTDNDTGVITLGTGAGANFSVADRVDVYWEVGGVKGHRRGMLVSAKTGDAITVGTAGGDVGLGDNFPAQDSIVVLSKSISYELRVDGDDVKAILAYADARAIIVLAGADGAEDFAIVLAAAGKSYAWYSTSGEANPIATDVITQVFISQGDTSGAKAVRIACPYT